MGFDIAIVGATGLVGTTLISILEDRQFPINQLFLLSSHRSVGETREFKGRHLRVEELSTFDFHRSKICFFCVDAAISEIYVPKAVEAGNLVIDKSSHYRDDPDVPLVVPEVNGDILDQPLRKSIIASPNCSTVPIVMALKTIYDAVGLTRINAVTYQSVSGTGKKGITELADQTAALLNGLSIKPNVYPQQIAFNVLPHIDDFHANGYTEEEMKIVREIHKIMNDETIAVNPMTVRVPVFYGHSVSLYVETKTPLSVKKAKSLLSKAPGVVLTMGKYPYATPVQQAAGEDAVFVGRLREDLSNPLAFNCWVLTDNIRKGAALNAVQIVETLMGAQPELLQ